MGTSPFLYRPRLYRKWARAVTRMWIAICLVALAVLLLSEFAAAQYAKKRKPDTGPRAVGLLKIDAKGRAQLVPVAIRIDGKFYDAGAYKADPVPMALQQDTVYEGVKAGVSQGIFTTAGSARGTDSWFADGKWKTNAQIEADKARAKAEAEKKAQKASDEPVNGGPPRLTRPGDAPPKATKTADSQKTPPPVPAAGATPSPAAASSTTSTSPPKDSPAKDSAPSKADSDRPVLRRQEVSETSHEQTKITPDDLTGPFQWVPAISDAGGPEPRPYAYQMKPDEEAAFLKKMLVLAGQEVTTRATAGNAEEAKSKAQGKDKAKTTRSAHVPEFQDVQLRVFDLSSSNEPVLILTANATEPGRADVVFSIALVAREDIYGDLHKVSALLTDNQHLDELPKYDFIDAVDADGDGRAELLFRLTSEAGSAYAIYSVIGDKLWPLFEGKPGT